MSDLPATTPPLERAVWLLNEFSRLAAHQYPYIYGGGHGVAPIPKQTFPPTKGEDKEGTNPVGYDCSAWQSAGLWHAGMLGSGAIKNVSLAPGTEELEGWGSAGLGKYYTLFVRDTNGVHHCVGKFTFPGQEPVWTAANKTGTTCGFFDWGDWDPTTVEYRARHFPGV
jgi:hypothetical protein